ncbi:MAG: U32 family peptidase [Bacteroidales bacterium]|nr:U32 family peptidase [Bacteroidales bacterium]
MKRSDFEIMAPVGSYESLQAAIQGGANAVYFGLERLNMRARSSVNFTEEDLPKIVSICQEHQVKTYLTLNVVIYNEELDKARQLVDLAKMHKVSAIIASDQSIIQYAYEQGVEIHLSTQINISNIESLKFYSNFADVVVLARELNLDQVATIYHEIREQDVRGPSGELIRIEMFVHGALCMAISGKCYLSLHEMNYSANRGGCLQVCRRGYTVTDNETGRELEVESEYIMSPKDLRTIHFFNKLVDAGVRVFKIEGRARPAEYVKTVCQCYSEALDSILENTYNENKIANWNQRLGKVFNRGYWDGYYLGQKLGEWSHIYGSKATRRKKYIGKCTNYFSNIGVAEFTCEADVVTVGNEILVIGPTTGVVEMTIEEIREDLKPVEKTTQGTRFSIKTPELVRRGDKLYLWEEVFESSS